MFSLLAGREFAFGKVRFTLGRGVAFTLPAAALTDRFALTALFVFEFALLSLAFSFAFLFFGLFGLFSLRFAVAFALRFSLVSSGFTLSGVSPSLVARLISTATV